MRRALRALRRLVGCVAHTLQGAAICAFAFPRLDAAARMAHVGRWSAQLLARLDIECVVQGEPPHPGPVMLAANHVSWLDIVAVDAVQPSRFVSKAEARHWPLLGWLIACGGTLFIERGSKRDAMRVVHRVADALRDGDVIAFFPEGTTSFGDGLLPFHANLLQAAISAGAPVQPVALRYSDATHVVSRAAAYVGDTSLLESLWAVLWADRLRVTVTLLPVLPASHGLDRRALAAVLRERIGAALGSMEGGRS